MEWLLSFTKTISTSASVGESPNSSTEADGSSLHLHHCTSPHVPFSNMFKKQKYTYKDKKWLLSERLLFIPSQCGKLLCRCLWRVGLGASNCFIIQPFTFFFLRICWSLWMHNLWCFPLSCDNECQWASWSRSLSFEKHLTEELT